MPTVSAINARRHVLCERLAKKFKVPLPASKNELALLRFFEAVADAAKCPEVTIESPLVDAEPTVAPVAAEVDVAPIVNPDMDQVEDDPDMLPPVEPPADPVEPEPAGDPSGDETNDDETVTDESAEADYLLDDSGEEMTL